MSCSMGIEPGVRPSYGVLREAWRRIDSFARRHWFALALLFIGAASAYDGYLVQAYRDCILYTEKNPVALRLIQLGAGDVSLMLRFKAAGTLLCLTALTWLQVRLPHLAAPVTGGVAAFQMLLMLFLSIF